MRVRENITEIDILYKKKIKSANLVLINSSQKANKVLRSIWSDKIELLEDFVVLVLNRGNKCLGWVKISQGGLTGTMADSKLILAIAIKSAACGIIVCHNHPSGEVKPSANDITLTKKLDDCCKLFDIKLLDHIILSGDSDHYYSFSDESLL